MGNKAPASAPSARYPSIPLLVDSYIHQLIGGDTSRVSRDVVALCVAFYGSQNDRIKVKVTNNDDTRLWRYFNTSDYEGLCAFIKSVWQNDDFIVQYKDDEGDLITIASAQDLADAFDSAEAEQMKSLKLFVKFDVKQKRKQQTAHPKSAF